MKIGPVLGILSIPRAHANHFMGVQSESFTEILQAAEEMNCTAFVFSPFEINWLQQVVWGYRFNPGGDWERSLFPLPDVVYNRIPNRTLENRDDVAQILALLKQIYGRRIFNPCFLDKWQTHKILFNNERARPHLPETYLLDSPAVISEMLEKHGAVYLKPTGSSLGNDIIKATRKGPGYFHFIHQCLNREPREGIVRKAAELYELLPASEEPASFLVQQAVKLACCQGQPFDLRLLMQRNSHGRWQRSGMAARIAGSRSITTHVMYGGSRFSALKAIKQAAEVCQFSADLVLKRLSILQFQVPKTIEKAHNHLFGELEMDLGIDVLGQVWLFEANSKPFRFDENRIRLKSLTRLIDYVFFLAGPESGKPV